MRDVAAAGRRPPPGSALLRAACRLWVGVVPFFLIPLRYVFI